MMKLTLMIEGSKSAIAAVIASLPDDGSVTVQPFGGGSPGMNNPAPVPQMPTMPAPADDEGDDNGPVNANAPSVDSSGLPWDERIHSGTKTTKGDGTWTGRRGGPKGAEYDAIVAELRSRTQQPVSHPAPQLQPAPVPMMPAMPTPQPAPNVAPAAAPMPMPVPAPVGMEQPAVGAAPVYSPPPMPEQVTQQPAPVPMAPPVQQPAPAPIQTAVAAATGTLDFAQFMQHLSGQMTKRDGNGAPLIHADYLAGITAEISQAFAPQGIPALTAITDISTNPQMITYAMQCMQRDQRW